MWSWNYVLSVSRNTKQNFFSEMWSRNLTKRDLQTCNLLAKRIGAEHVSLVNIHRCFTSIVSIPNAKSTSPDKNAAKEEPSLLHFTIFAKHHRTVARKHKSFFVQAIWLLQTILVHKNTYKPNRCSFYSFLLCSNSSNQPTTLAVTVDLFYATRLFH